MQTAFLLINIFIIPTIIFMVNYIWKGATTNFAKVTIFYVVNCVANFVISSGLLLFFNFLFSTSFSICDFVYSIMSVISSFIISFIIVCFKINFEFKSELKKVDENNEEK